MTEAIGPLAFCFPPEPRPGYRWNEAWRSEPVGAECLERTEDFARKRGVSETSLAQVELFAASVAAARLVRQRWGVTPAFAVPHSVGLYAALVDTGVWSLEQGLDYTITAGEFIHDFTRNGGFAMAAILGFPEDVLLKICNETGGGGKVHMVGHNAPRFSTIAGDREATQRVLDRVLAEGATDARFLPSPAPLHTGLVWEIRDRLRRYIADWSLGAPAYPIVHPYHARVVTPDELPGLPADHMVMQVRWREAAGFVLSQGVRLFVETGGVKVLSKFVAWIDSDVTTVSITEPTDIRLLSKIASRARHEEV
ncbi:MAG: ACP S-malonyltransferase [Planctomycetota bacterium]